MSKAKKAKATKATKALKRGGQPAKPGTATHYTDKGTRKYQCNGDVAWAKVFAKLANGGREGEGIRAALAYAVAHAEKALAWSKGEAEKAEKAAAKSEGK